MTTMTGKAGKAMAGNPDITAQLATHDAAIGALGGRIHGVETGLRTLQGEVHNGFSGLNNTLLGLNSKIDQFGARPQFDFHKTVGTVVALAVLFTMICGGIIYITTSQTSAVVAEQKVFNGVVAKALEKHDQQIETINGWRTTMERYPAASARGAMK
jgi:hypothetical protein